MRIRGCDKPCNADYRTHAACVPGSCNPQANFKLQVTKQIEIQHDPNCFSNGAHLLRLASASGYIRNSNIRHLSFKQPCFVPARMVLCKDVAYELSKRACISCLTTVDRGQLHTPITFRSICKRFQSIGWLSMGTSQLDDDLRRLGRRFDNPDFVQPCSFGMPIFVDVVVAN